MKVGLLIGDNCPKALEPMQVIQSRNGGPYAYHSRLGWCVAGPIDGISSSRKYNLAAVQTVATMVLLPIISLRWRC